MAAGAALTGSGLGASVTGSGLGGSWTGSGTYMHVLDQSTGKLSTTDNNLWHIAVGIENPTIILNGGYYYLFGSKGLCCSGVNSTYYTVVGRSTSGWDATGGNYSSTTPEDGGVTLLSKWPILHKEQYVYKLGIEEFVRQVDNRALVLKPTTSELH